jgi:hypothetical protein
MIKKTKFFIVQALIFLLIATACSAKSKTTAVINATTNVQESTISQQEMNQAMDKLKPVIINELTKNYNLFSIVVELKSTITLDQSWGSWEIFKKSQAINFCGNGTYATGIENINSENLEIDTANKRITLTLKNPVPVLVAIDEQKTTANPSNTGLLRFGDIKLTADEKATLTQEMTAQMQQMMIDKALYAQELSDFSKNIEQILQQTLQNSSLKEYTVSVYYE